MSEENWRKNWVKEIRGPDDSDIETRERELTPEELEKLVEKFNEGFLTSEECDRILKKHNEERRWAEEDSEIEEESESQQDVESTIESEGRRTYKDLDPERVHRLYFEEKRTPFEIAKIFGFKSNKVVRTLFKVMGWEPRHPGHSTKEVDSEEVRRLHFDEGQSFSEIAEHLGFKSRSRLTALFKEQGWKARRISKGEIDPEEAYRMYFDDKMSLREIAEHFGYKTGHPVSRIFKEQGWETRDTRKDLDPEEVHKLFYEEGLSFNQIAEKLDVSLRPVRRVFKEQGWTARDTRKDLDPEEVHRLYFEEELSMREISKHFGFKSATPIFHLFQEQKWEARYQRLDTGFYGIYGLYYEEGWTKDEIIEHFECSLTNPAQHIMEEQGAEARAVEKDLDPDEVYRLYYEEGLSRIRVAEKLGISCDSIRRIFKEQEWELKNPLTVKEIRDFMFGGECAVCGQDRDAIHKKDGQPHPTGTLWTKKSLMTLDQNDWVALCYGCHRVAHLLMKHHDLNWNEIERLLSKLKPDNDQ